MRRFCLVIAILLFVSVSCTDIIFRQNNFGSPGLDFTNGTWLVNEIISEDGGQAGEKLTVELIDGLKEMGGKSIIYIETPWKKGLLQDTIPFTPDPSMLISIRESDGFDYLINVSISSVMEESGGLAIGEQELQNEAMVKIKVFDLSLQKQVYYQEITGFEEWPLKDEMEEIPSRYAFTRSSENILRKALKRGLRDMRK